MRRDILYLQAAMYYFVYNINILPKRRSQLNSHFKTRTPCHLFMGLSQKCVKNYHKLFFTCGDTFFFSSGGNRYNALQNLFSLNLLLNLAVTCARDKKKLCIYTSFFYPMIANYFLCRSQIHLVLTLL